MKRGRHRPRLADVARLADVSEATASVVLNNRVGANTRVSEETQSRVWDAARSLGYVPNPLARHLAGGVNRLLAIFTFEPVFPIDLHDFYYPFLIGIEEEAARCGYDLLLVTSSTDDFAKRQIYRDGINRLQLAAGAILLGNEDKAEIERLLEDEFPFVFIGRRESANDAISYVAADYVTATADLVNHLFASGHQTIAYLLSGAAKESTYDRSRGFHRAYEEHGVMPDPDLLWAGSAEQLTAEVLRVLLQKGVTAFVTEDDGLARRVLQLADQLRLRCPDDFSLAVLGDPLNMTEPRQDWTTFSIPRREMGREAVRLLLKILSQNEQPAPLRVTLPCTFLPGTTTAAPRARP